MFQNSENGVHSCFHSENWKVSPTTTMPVREALESRFVNKWQWFINKPICPVQWAHKIILHDSLVKHGNMCAHIERCVRYLHRKSYIHLSLKEASTQLTSHADVLRGAWRPKRTSAWEATKRWTTPWTLAVSVCRSSGGQLSQTADT